MHQYQQGKSTTQGHKGIPEGHFEEEQGRKGFFGPVSHLIKPKPSTRWTQIEGPLRPHLYDVVALDKKYGQWTRLLYNSSVTISKMWNQKSEHSAQAFRNADGDTLYFVHQGSGVVLTEYGLLKFRKGHYINMPKCCTHQFYFEEETMLLVIESHLSSYEEPERGMVGRNAFYDPAAFGKPHLEALHAWKKQMSWAATEIIVKRWNQQTKFTYTECVFDAVGWKGDFFPFTLHVDDLMPMISARVHLPPSAHTTFVARGFVVCTFLPRPLESDADALKVPFYHQNIDYDEVLFYHDGNFFSRDNLHAGMITLHPAGFPHGPHPKAVKNIGSKTHTDEYAVMIDSWETLHVDPLLNSVEVPEYWNSWNK
ncbi:MAG: homogentisate 1,2-dioxygenase [Proteobacteria bacterium]|jgi:homogentisate 1,2-dioxygenase|nr:homogentisate 1,2-dioxygenase [Pseudomonadota bacterium]